MKLSNLSKTILVVVAVSCFSNVANAQATLKMYSNYTYSTDRVYRSTVSMIMDSFTTIESKNTNINVLPAVCLTKSSGRYIEYALANFSIKRNNDKETLTVDDNKTVITGIKSTQTALSARSEVGKKMDFFKAESKFGLELGLANTYSFYKLKVEPKVSNAFPFRVNQGSVDVAFAPRLSYNLTSNCALEFSTLLGLAEVSFESTKIKNPALDVSQQISNTIEMEVMPMRYVFRLGFAYKL